MGGYLGVINRVMFIVYVFYFLVGFFGYFHYGDAVLGSITLNLPESEYVCKVVLKREKISIIHF